MNLFSNKVAMAFFGIAYIIAVIAYYVFYWISERYNLYRVTEKNKKVPKVLGGILTVTVISTLIIGYFNQDYLNVTLKIKNVIEMCIGALAFFIVGYYFDNKQVVAKKKILLEVLVMGTFVLFTSKIWFFNFAETGNQIFQIDYAKIINYGLNTGITVLWYMLIINGINIMRRIERLVSGISVMVSASFLVMTLFGGSYEVVVTSSIILAISLCLTVTKVYINNITGMTYGFLFAYMGIEFLFKMPTLISTALLVLSLPIFNIIYVVYKRLKRGTIISIRDNDHIFYRLQDKGYSNQRILGIMYIITFLMGSIAYLVVRTENPWLLIAAATLVAILGVEVENMPQKNAKIKVMSIFGTRPEAIKMAPVIYALEEDPDIDSVVCVTGQHKEMLYQVLDSFNIFPRYDLNIMKNRQTLVGISSRILKVLERVVKREKPDLILVHGDTTSTFVAAFLGCYMNVEVGHVEAGLRTYKRLEPFPEETNRVLTGALATLHFAPSKIAKHNLLREGVPEDAIFLTGNTAVDSTRYTYQENYIFKEDVLNSLDFEKNKVIIMTAHRRESFGEPLRNICEAVRTIVERNKDVVVVYAVHKNPNVVEVAHSILGNVERVHLIDPIDVFDMHNVMKRAYLMLTDSGGLQEEAPSFHLPTVVLRNVTERPEGLETGILKLAGTDKNKIIEITEELLNSKEEYEKMRQAKNPYGDGYAANRIVEAIRYKYGVSDIKPDDFDYNDISVRKENKKMKKIESTEILGVRIDKVNMDQAIKKIFEFYDEEGIHIVHTTNPEFILTAQDDPEYKEILNGAALAVPDGVGAVMASKFKKVKLVDRVPGCDLALNLMDKMQNTKYSVYLLGAPQASLDNALKNLKEKYPNLTIAGSHNGYFKDPDDEAIIKDINDSGATLLLVGLGGIPKQEKWVWKYKDRLNVKVTIGVGGSIDVYSGAVKRAPKIYQKLRLEWLYRTLSEPKKRLPRVYRLPMFVLLSAKESFFGNKKKNK